MPDLPRSRCSHGVHRSDPCGLATRVTRPLVMILLGLPISTSAWAGPPVMLAQVTISELGAAQQARQEMEAEAAGAAAGRVQMSDEDASVEPGDAAAGGDAATTEGGGGGVLKYLPSYGLLILLVGLGTFAACRPVRRTAPDGT